MGSLQLKRLDSNKFQIIGVGFHTDVCFGEYACYREELKNDIDMYIGRILDFSDVELMNNFADFTYF